MRDEDKPFVCYKSGRWSMHITPRNGVGWRALVLWILALLAGTHGLIWLVVTSLGEDAAFGVALAVLGFAAIWSWAMIRWMLARSEVINTDDLLAMKREQDRRKGKRG